MAKEIKNFLEDLDKVVESSSSEVQEGLKSRKISKTTSNRASAEYTSVSFAMKTDTYKKLKILAIGEDKTFKDIVNEVLEKYLIRK